VLQPVLENACRYGRERARLRIVRDGSRVLFLVDDDGPGVPDEERETIFEPGVRGSAAVDGGAGLGLALARRLARAASGDVTTDGERFVVSLPAA
jgi:signal transduction histidine kinase